nr:hypothetical protein CFP56_11315 [Quercus suber]
MSCLGTDLVSPRFLPPQLLPAKDYAAVNTALGMGGVSCGHELNPDDMPYLQVAKHVNLRDEPGVACLCILASLCDHPS